MDTIQYISENIKSIYSSIYSENEFLLKLNNHIINNIKKEYGENNVYYSEQQEKLSVRTNQEDFVFNFPNIKYILNLNLPSELEQFSELSSKNIKWPYLIS